MAVVQELGEAVHTQVQAYIAAMEARKIREGSRLAMGVSSIGEALPVSGLMLGTPWCSLALNRPRQWQPAGHCCADSNRACPGRLSWQWQVCIRGLTSAGHNKDQEGSSHGVKGPVLAPCEGQPKISRTLSPGRSCFTPACLGNT